MEQSKEYPEYLLGIFNYFKQIAHDEVEALDVSNLRFVDSECFQNLEKLVVVWRAFIKLRVVRKSPLDVLLNFKIAR